MLSFHNFVNTPKQMLHDDKRERLKKKQNVDREKWTEKYKEQKIVNKNQTFTFYIYEK